MATLSLNDPKVMTCKKGSTRQVLLFSEILKNSSNSKHCSDHESRIEERIQTLSEVTGKFDELKAKGGNYKPSFSEIGTLYQNYLDAAEA